MFRLKPFIYSSLKRRQLLGLLVVSGMLFLSCYSTLQAQEATLDASSEATPDASPPTVFSNPSQSARIAALQEVYSQRIEAYQTAERQYRLAKSQHQKLQSLISLEEAVQATRQVMQQRTDVLLSYVDLLYAELQDTLGLELTDKDAQSKQLETTVALLREHRTSLDSANSRDDIAAEVVAFKPLYERVTKDSEKTRSLIAVGRMQLVYDKAQIVRTDIQKLQESYEVSTLKKSERDRAYTEIERQFATTSDALRSLRQEVASEKGTTSYTTISGKLLTISSGLSRIVSYLEEVLRI